MKIQVEDKLFIESDGTQFILKQYSLVKQQKIRKVLKLRFTKY